MTVARVAVRQLFKVRTWLLGGTVAGGTAAANVRDIQLLVVVFLCLQKYDEWKNSLPDIPWLADNEQLAQLKDSVLKMKVDMTDMSHERAARMMQMYDGERCLMTVEDVDGCWLRS
jgi:hypothetical protein